MQYLKQIQSGIDFIESHLDADIELADVAKAANLSQWHFQRIFKALTNETLKTYIRSRRLALSMEKLLYTDARIVDIAMDAGYQSQEAFANACKASYGLTPSEYRKIGDKSLFLRKAKIDEEYLEHINRGLSLEPIISVQPQMVMVGLSTRFYGVDSDKNNIGEKLPTLWREFMPRVPEINGVVGDVLYGVVRQTGADTDELEYFAAAQVEDANESIPEGMVATTIPTATYAYFWHHGIPQKVDMTVNYIYSNWLFGSGRRHTGGPDLEMYGAEYLADSEHCRFRYAIPVE